jgi:phosphoglycolate phosphatase
MYKYIFFDLDGTITDPFDGITACVKYALEQFGISACQEDLKSFIGPPLKDEFMRRFSLSEKEAEEAVAWYRKRYPNQGIFECTLYNGIAELLERLSKEHILTLATSKPLPFAERILEHFDIKKYFTQIVGATFDGRLSEKTEVLAEALRITGAPLDECVMIGDRLFDTQAGVENGIASIGVTYGYGTADEHKNAIYIADSVNSLAEFFGMAD